MSEDMNARTLIDAAHEKLCPPVIASSEFPYVSWVSQHTDWSVTPVNLEEHADAPRRVRQNTTHETPASFCQYVDQFKTGATRIFASLDAASVVAQIDYHEPGEASASPSWVTHKATYPAKLDPSFKAWRNLHGQPIRQREFSEFLEDRAEDAVSPDPADLMELASKFEAVRNVDFKSAVNLATGERQFKYEEKDAAKGAINIPKMIKLRTPIYYGTDPVDWVALFSYSIDEGKLSFRVKIHRIEQLLDAAFDRLIAGVAESLPTVTLHRGEAR